MQTDASQFSRFSAGIKKGGALLLPPKMTHGRRLLFVAFPLDEAGIDVDHGVDDQFHQAAVGEAVLGVQIAVFQHFADLALAVGAGSADVLLGFGAKAVLEGLGDLPHLFTAGDVAAPFVDVLEPPPQQ